MAPKSCGAGVFGHLIFRWPNTPPAADAPGAVTSYGYDPAGHRTAVTDPNNHTSTYQYDALNRQTAATDPALDTTTTTYDPAGNVTATVSPRGFRTTYSYDALNRKTQVRDAANGYTTTVYDAAGNVSAAIDARNNRTTYGYDAVNRRTSRTDALSHTVTTVYDLAGNVTRGIDAGGFATTYQYDALNRRTSAQDPGTGVVTTAYDRAGNVTASTDQVGDVTTFAYDALNRQTQQTDARNGLTTYLYDANSNRTAVVDPDANRTTFAYDVLNRLTLQTDPLNKGTTLAYDAAGQKTSVIDRLGRQTTLAYDAAGREAGETWLNADSTLQQRVTYGYDADGNRTAAASGAGAYTYAYDVLGRLTAVQEPFGLALTYGYDAVSNRTLVLDSKGGTTTSAYDNANRPTSEQFSGTSPAVPLRIDFSYTARDQVQTQTRYADLQGNTKVGATSYVYDAVGRVQNLQHYNGAGSPLANTTYGYDLASRLTSQTENGGAPTTYTYDVTNQLTADGHSTHTYDLNGNRTDTGYVTPSDNQLTQAVIGGVTWTYSFDAEGNLAKKTRGTNAETWTYGYDNRDQMLWAKDSATDGGTVLQLLTFTYDVDAHRLQKVATAGGTTTTLSFGYDGSSAWADLDGSNALVTRRLFGNAINQLFARQSAGGTAAWYLPDRQGSIRQLTDNGGVVIDALTYDGFGVVTSESIPASGDRYQYATGQADKETGLVLYWHRYLDPATLRFTSGDPVFDADTNLYRYARNSPTNATDPTGFDIIWTSTSSGKTEYVDSWGKVVDLPQLQPAPKASPPPAVSPEDQKRQVDTLRAMYEYEKRNNPVLAGMEMAEDLGRREAEAARAARMMLILMYLARQNSIAQGSGPSAPASPSGTSIGPVQGSPEWRAQMERENRFTTDKLDRMQRYYQAKTKYDIVRSGINPNWMTNDDLGSLRIAGGELHRAIWSLRLQEADERGDYWSTWFYMQLHFARFPPT